ncbi:MAG: hypothetical protein WAK84_09640 [Candidatus Cybelea sp.]
MSRSAPRLIQDGEAFGGSRDPPRSAAGVAIVRLCCIPPGPAIGGCDAPQPASIVIATLMLVAQQLNRDRFIAS